MNKFLENEKIGRELWFNFCQCKKLGTNEFTKNIYDTIDSILTTKNGYKVAVEIKVRDVKYLDYDTHLLEASKLKSMLKASKNALYVNFFGDNDLIIYDKNAFQNAVAETKACRRKSSVKSDYIDKEVLFLDSKLGIRYTKDEEGDWIKLLNL